MAQTMSYLPRRLYPSQGFPILLVWYSSLLFLVSFDHVTNLGIIGHRWCSSCLKKHKGDPLCGECRQPKGKPHRIYLDLEDLADDQVALVADGLNAINMESSPSAIEKFNRAVRKLRQKPNIDPAVSVSIVLNSTKKYDHSLIIPSFTSESTP